MIFFCLAAAVSAAPEQGRADGAGSRSGKVMVLRLGQNISLDELLRRERCSIDDARMVEFLQDFIRLNADIRSISRLKKGSTVRIPLRHVSRTPFRKTAAHSDAEFYRPRTRVAQRPPARLTAGKDEAAALSADLRWLRAVSVLFDALGKNVRIENDGVKVFQLAENRDLSLDASRFPMIDLRDKRVILLDLPGALPQEIRDIIEISWPEYRIVTSRGAGDLRSFVALILGESGYDVQRSERIVSGGISQVEYRPDFFVTEKSESPASDDLVFVTVLERTDRRTPAGLISWFGERGVRLVELMSEERHPDAAAGAGLTLTARGDRRAMVRDLLERFGQRYAENANLTLSRDKGVGYSLTADYLIDAGPRRKAIVFSAVNEPERSYASKLGIDLVGLGPDVKSAEVPGRVATLLAFRSSGDPRLNAQAISPRNARYRLYLPGTYAQLPNGRFFVTDTDMQDGLLKEIVAEGISIVKY